MKDPSFDTKITVAKTSSANTSSWSDSIEESLDKGATMKDPTSNIKVTVEKAPSTNSNNKNNAQTYSKAENQDCYKC